MDGRLQADPKKFPSGLKALSDRLGGMGETLCSYAFHQQCFFQPAPDSFSSGPERSSNHDRSSSQQDVMPWERSFPLDSLAAHPVIVMSIACIHSGLWHANKHCVHAVGSPDSSRTQDWCQAILMEFWEMWAEGQHACRHSVGAVW